MNVNFYKNKEKNFSCEVEYDDEQLKILSNNNINN